MLLALAYGGEYNPTVPEWSTRYIVQNKNQQRGEWKALLRWVELLVARWLTKNSGFPLVYMDDTRRNKSNKSYVEKYYQQSKRMKYIIKHVPKFSQCLPVF